jgi:protein involved in polysaccharide export with SLBB domain
MNKSTPATLSTGVVLLLLAGMMVQPTGEGAGSAQRPNAAGAPEAAQHPFLRGDAVRISVYPDTALFVNGTYRIDDDGFVALPIVGRMRIDSLTTGQFESFLDTAYMRYLRYPAVEARPLMRLALLGGFQKPGLYYVSPRASLWEAVAQAGGPIREDGLKKLRWEREGKLLRGGLLSALEAGTSLAAFGVRSGDQLWVTHIQKRDGWDILTSEVLPIVSISISAATAFGTLYFAYQVNAKGK